MAWFERTINDDENIVIPHPHGNELVESRLAKHWEEPLEHLVEADGFMIIVHFIQIAICQLFLKQFRVTSIRNWFNRAMPPLACIVQTFASVIPYFFSGSPIGPSSLSVLPSPLKSSSTSLAVHSFSNAAPKTNQS